ncbi:MAG: hypothetical protein ACXWL5_00585 [Candidatus Chromulinivorax sp.]
MNKFLTVMIFCSFVLSADDSLKNRFKSDKSNDLQRLTRNLESNRMQRGVTIAEPFDNDGLDACCIPVIALTHNLVFLCCYKPIKMQESIDCAQNFWSNFKQDLITESNRRTSYYY